MKRSRPVIIGIVGDSAAGKTTLTRGLVNILGADRVTHVCTDDYHKYDRQERAQLPFTALHPDCNHIDIMELHLERLHYNQPILKPVYDHSTGSLVRPEYLEPREFIIVEGLLGFFSPVARQFIDIKVFLDPPEELRRRWKIRRDTTKRGYSPEQVLAELDKREAESRTFIRPQRDEADIVVCFSPPADAPHRDSELNARLVLRPTLPHPDLSYLVDSEHTERGIRLKLGRDAGRPVDFLEIDGHVTDEHATELQTAIQSHLPDLPLPGGGRFGDFQDGAARHHSSSLGLTQLLLTYHVLRTYRDVVQMPFAPPIAAMRRVNFGRRHESAAHPNDRFPSTTLAQEPA
ncbi:MAG TPA: phosphoribulokinase [Longimicrobiales bacterium]|nr:phosphoribulokinase [Longimicrobiales bacterium]